MKSKKSSSIYVLSGNPEVDHKIQTIIKTVSSRIENIYPSSALNALVLGGSFGRGEGQYTQENNYIELYNDLDFFIFLNGFISCKSKLYQQQITQLAHDISEYFDIEIDFGLPINAKRISKLSNCLRWLDLKFGHRVILGNENILASYPYNYAYNLPYLEAIKLLLNRAVGLILAKNTFQKLILLPHDISFILRIIRKAYLALGDALLILNNLYEVHLPQKTAHLKQLAKTNKSNQFIYEKYLLNTKAYLNNNLSPTKLKELLLNTISDFAQYYLELFSIYSNTKLTTFNEYFRFIKLQNYYANEKTKNFIRNTRYFKLKHGLNKVYLKHPFDRLLFCWPYFLPLDAKINKKDVCSLLVISRNAHDCECLKRFINLWQHFN
jgi:hypothetical protein